MDCLIGYDIIQIYFFKYLFAILTLLFRLELQISCLLFLLFLIIFFSLSLYKPHRLFTCHDSPHSQLHCYTGGGEGNGADEWVNMDLEREGDGDEEESDEDEQMGFVHKQPLVATGMAATLALLKGSGEAEGWRV